MLFAYLYVPVVHSERLSAPNLTYATLFSFVYP